MATASVSRCQMALPTDVPYSSTIIMLFQHFLLITEDTASLPVRHRARLMPLANVRPSEKTGDWPNFQKTSLQLFGKEILIL